MIIEHKLNLCSIFALPALGMVGTISAHGDISFLSSLCLSLMHSHSNQTRHSSVHPSL